MRFRLSAVRFTPLLLVWLLLAACGPSAAPPTAPSAALPSPTHTPIPTPIPSTPEQVGRVYLQAWERADYAAMYDLLSAAARERIQPEQFSARYRAIREGVGVLGLTTTLQAASVQVVEGQSASVPFSVERRTGRLGTLREDNVLHLVWETSGWKVDWRPNLIFRQLTDDGLIRMLPRDGARGPILDRHGNELASDGEIVEAGLVPGQLEDRAAVLELVHEHLGLDPEQVNRSLDRAQPDWFVPLKELSAQQADALPDALRDAPGVILRRVTARIYPLGEATAHVVGYLTALGEDELRARAEDGYEHGDLAGRVGIEGWAEAALAGQRGGELRVVAPDGSLVATIASREAQPGGRVRLTLDSDLQRLAADALGDRPGSVVALDPATNEVLALVSKPSFDPNRFILGWSQEDWDALNADERLPFLNRPTEGAYPTGSIFKLVTATAALREGSHQPSSQFVCTGQWRGLGGDVVLGDWLPQGHGSVTLSSGLTQSCNIVFYELGKTLDAQDPRLLPRYARDFGFGKETGLVGLTEHSGLVPDPAWKEQAGLGAWYTGDSVNLAIGQGYFLATPLQVANAVAALARGGELKTPVLVREVVGPSGQQTFQSQDLGRLPLSTQHLQVLRDAMVGVTRPPIGTAAQAFRGFSVSVAGKTGSAETQGEDAHAWFAGYAPSEQPRIALVIMVEERGLGAEVAAPVAREILERYLQPTGAGG